MGSREIPTSLLNNQAKRLPVSLPYFAYSDGLWAPIEDDGHTRDDGDREDPPLFPSLRLVTWNIDFGAPDGVRRMATALRHLELHVLSGVPKQEAVVIFLQENTYEDLRLILAQKWVQERFYVTDTDMQAMGASYGTTVLIDNRVAIGGNGVQRLSFVSHFGRDGLFVDLSVRPREAGPGGTGQGRDGVIGQQAERGSGGAGSERSRGPDPVLRLCNVHLESLASNPPLRPVQFYGVSPYLKPSARVHASLMAGDMNAIRPYDLTLPAEHGLEDAFLTLGGTEGADEGNTWGHQSGKTRFPPGRLDKILFAGGVVPKSLDRIGMGVRVGDVSIGVGEVGGGDEGEDEPDEDEDEEDGRGDFVTDHYGLVGVFELQHVGLVRGGGAE